jgi:hypothetical protein
VATKHELEVLDINVEVPQPGLHVMEQVIQERAEGSHVAHSNVLLVEDVDDAILVEVALKGLDDENGIAH